MIDPMRWARRFWRAFFFPGARQERARIAQRALGCLEIDIEAVGSDHGTPWIRLKSGRVFYGLPSDPLYLHQYSRLRHKLPPVLTPEAFHLANDIRWRYEGRRHRGLPGNGGVVVEAGAYIGLKAIRFAESVAPNGRVIAIEMMPQNARLLERNIRENHLEHLITPVQAGLWKERGELLVHSGGFQKNSAVDLDGHNFRDRQSVPMDTLDNILDRCGVDSVDYLNMQINGAEIEAVEGLRRRIGSVKLLRIAAYYHRGGTSNAESCCRALEKLGCQVIRTNGKSIFASPRHHATAQAALLDKEQWDDRQRRIGAPTSPVSDES